MFAAQLFALPVGTRVAWHDTGAVGTVVASGRARVVIRWDDGDELSLERGLEHVAEYAGAMEVVTDEPHVTNGRA